MGQDTCTGVPPYCNPNGIIKCAGPFSYTLTFDKPINNLCFRIDLADRGEEFYIQTSSDTPVINNPFGSWESTPVLVEGNKISLRNKSGLPGTGFHLYRS